MVFNREVQNECNNIDRRILGKFAVLDRKKIRGICKENGLR